MRRFFVFAWGCAALMGAMPAEASISITPRVSLYFDNSEQRQSGLGEAQNTEAELAETNAQLREIFGPTANFTAEPGESAIAANQLVFPMYGLSVTFGGQSTQFTLTGMYGKSNTRGRIVETTAQRFEVFDVAAEDILTTVATGEVDYDRYDVEATVQHRLNETFSIVGGLRYERVEGEGAFDVVNSSSSNIPNLVASLLGEPLQFELNRTRVDAVLRGTNETYSARAGAAAFVPVTQSLLAYVNGMLHLSYTPSSVSDIVVTDPATGETVEVSSDGASETSAGPDLSVGLLYRISQRVALDVRYRGIFYFPVSGDNSFDDPRVNHGVNVGLTFALGR